MGIGAKDQTNYLVAGSSRNVSQDSCVGLGACGREDVDIVNKLRTCERLVYNTGLVYVVRTSGQIVVSMICKKQRSWRQGKQPNAEQAVKVDDQVKTVGRWPWRLASAKKRVTTYLSNLGLAKIEGGDLQCETCTLVDWHTCCGEASRGRGVEGHVEQILEVVATMIRTLSRVHPLDRRR